MIELGDIVKCKYTGFKGTAVARTEFINGCIQYGVTGKVAKDNKFPDELSLDEGSLEIVKPRNKKPKKKETGGPTRKGPVMRGY